MHCFEKFAKIAQQQQSSLCVGLDPDLSKIPQSFQHEADIVWAFCKAVIDATADLVCAYKPQIAYFAALRAEPTLEKICSYIKEHYPHVPIILDAKRGDIDSTAKQYAREAFERYQADAVTVNPYMGFDAIAPFLEWTDRAVFILCKTSNQSGSAIQNLSVQTPQLGDVPLYQHIAHLVANEWNTSKQCGLVVGATFPEELSAIRKIVGNIPLLVPGIGAQGGSIEKIMQAGAGGGARHQLLLNSARAIIYPEEAGDFAKHVRNRALSTQQAINACWDAVKCI